MVVSTKLVCSLTSSFWTTVYESTYDASFIPVNIGIEFQYDHAKKYNNNNNARHLILIRKKIIHSHLPSKWNKKRKKNDTPISLIHSDAWGHTPVASLISHCYYVSVIENCTRCTWLYDYPVKSLVKVLSILCVFVRCFCLVLFSSFFGIKFIVIKILKKKASSIFKIFDKMTQIQMVLLRGTPRCFKCSFAWDECLKVLLVWVHLD